METWYKNSHLGEKRLKALLKVIATECGISFDNKKFTNQSGRKTLVQNLKSIGKTDYEVMSITRHKSFQSIASYERPKDIVQSEGLNALFDAVNKSGKFFCFCTFHNK